MDIPQRLSSKKPSPWPRVSVLKRRLTDKLRRRIYLHEQRADRMCRDSDYSLATSRDSLFYAGGSLALLSARSACRDKVQVSRRTGAIARPLGLEARS